MFMKIQEKLDKLYIESLRNKQSDIVTIIRGLKSVIKNYIIEVGSEDIKEEDVLKLIKSEVKKRKDAIELYVQGGRQDLADKEQSEIDFLMQFLPAQLSEEEVTKKVTEIVEGLADDQKSNKGIVIGIAMKQLGGSADGGTVAKVVTKLLS